jgi:hypothetical protein
MARSAYIRQGRETHGSTDVAAAVVQLLAPEIKSGNVCGDYDVS